MRECFACRRALPISKRERNPRKWCSESCRVWMLRHPGQTRHLPLTPPICAMCGGALSGNRFRTCSPECSIAYKRKQDRLRYAKGVQVGTCLVCNAPFVRRSGSLTCSPDCKKVYKAAQNRERRKSSPVSESERERLRSKNHLRRVKYGATSEVVRFTDIAERDRWRCHLCNKRIDQDLRYPDPMSGSLDHVVPLSAGGDHSCANVALAHLACNVRKGARGGGEQLAVFG